MAKQAENGQQEIAKVFTIKKHVYIVENVQ